MLDRLNPAIVLQREHLSILNVLTLTIIFIACKVHLLINKYVTQVLN